MLDKKPIIRTNHCRHGCVIPVGWVVNFVGTAKPLILQRSVGSVPKIYAENISAALAVDFVAQCVIKCAT